MQAKAIFLYYVRELARVTRTRRDIVQFAGAAVVHAAGHGAVALVAGAVAAALAQEWGARGLRSSPMVSWLVSLVSLFRPTRVESIRVSDEGLFLCGIGLAAVLVKGVAGVYATYVQGRIAGEVGSQLRLRLLDALLSRHRLRRPRHADQGEHLERLVQAGSTLEGKSPALAVSALTDRVREVELGLQQGLLGGLRALAQIVPLAALLVWLSPRMAAVAATVLVAFGATLGRLRSSYQSASRRAAHERGLLLEAADESVRHADLWVSYGAEDKARASVRQLGQSLARGAARLEARAAALSGANEVLGAAALLAAVAAAHAGWLGNAGNDGGSLLAFAVAFFLVYRPLRELTDARLALARAGGACSDLLAATAEASASDTARADLTVVPRRWPLAALELRRLVLPRGSRAPVTLHAEPGAVVAIVGATGAGKSTLLRTLLGLERAADGDVLFDGVSIAGAPAGPVARPFAWVPQDAPLLADTLAANVSLGAPSVDGLVSADPSERAADPREALESLGAGHLADALGGSRLGAGGRAVSGGERQWIALARAIATELPVLLLDEPTSGLDPAAQRHVLEAIGRLRGVRTVLLVTHRPEPLSIADVVFRLGDDKDWERAA
jgi:ABC-type multidrug transport system fused ATPase/permease subunit